MTKKAAICVGDITGGAGHILSRARGWPKIEAESLESAASAILAGNVSTAVILADRKLITASESLRFSDALARSPLCHAVSFLTAETGPALERMASRIRPSPTGEPGSLPRLLMIHPDFQKFVQGLSVRNVADLVAGPSASSPIVGKDCGVLYLIGHSSGFDEGFEKVAICRRASGIEAPADFRALACFYGASCRYDQPVLSPLPTKIMAARKVVNISCWGFGIQDHMFAPNLTVGQGLLESDTLDSMITSIRVFPFDRSDMLSLYYLINQGLPFAAVTALTNKLRLQRGKRADFFCFGDPEGYVEGCQQELECCWDGVIGFITGLGSSNGPDIAVPFPEGVDQSDKVVLIGPDSAGISCGISAAGYVFISRSSEPAPKEVVLRLLRVDDAELSILSLPLELIADFHHLEHFNRSLHTIVKEDEGGELAQLSAAIHELRTLLTAWPLASIQSGDVLRAAEISNAFHDLALHLNALGNAFTDLYLSLLSRGSVFLLLLGNDLGTSESHCSENETCRYCGQPVDESVVLSWSGQPSRINGCCHVCGPIYDVGPGNGKWISSDPVRIGVKSGFKLSIRNAYKFPTNAFAAVAIPPFGPQPAVAATKSMLVPPGEMMSLTLEFELPAEFFPGSYYAVGFVILGTSVSFFRRPLIIAR